MTHSSALWGLPDPDREAEFYQDIPTKRFFAWMIDTLLTGLLTLLIVPFTAFTALFFLPLLYVTVNFIYRVVSISRHSATPGMRLVSIELRTGNGERFDFATALLHTIGYVISVSMVIIQLVSIGFMLTSSRAQGLTDIALGTAAVNRAARS